MQSSDFNAMPLREVISSYERAHGVALAPLFKTATQAGASQALQSALRSALISGRPIPDLDGFVLRWQSASKPTRQAPSSAPA